MLHKVECVSFLETSFLKNSFSSLLRKRIRDGRKEDKDGGAVESSGRVAVDDGINCVDGRANKETDREDRDGVGRDSPLKVMLSSSNISKGSSRYQYMGKTSQRPVLLETPYNVVVVKVGGEVEGREIGGKGNKGGVRETTHTVAGKIPAND
jgi:hypothetical protein